MSITVSTAKIIRKERKEIIQTVQKELKEAVVDLHSLVKELIFKYQPIEDR